MIMKKENIKQVIKNLFKENVSVYAYTYREPARAEKAARQVGVGYWVNRNDEEIERDKEAGVTQRDYEKWVIEELREYKANQPFAKKEEKPLIQPPFDGLTVREVIEALQKLPDHERVLKIEITQHNKSYGRLVAIAKSSIENTQTGQFWISDKGGGPRISVRLPEQAIISKWPYEL